MVYPVKAVPQGMAMRGTVFDYAIIVHCRTKPGQRIFLPINPDACKYYLHRQLQMQIKKA
jgi:hypothetical protein